MKIFFKIFFLILPIAAAYTAFTAYNPIQKGMSAIVVDKQSGSVVYAAEEGQRFVLLNALWWKYSVEKVPLENFLTKNIRVDIPALKDLKEDVFAVIIPVKADFSAIPLELYDLNLLKNSAEGLKKAVEDELEADLSFSIRDYLAPVYKGDVIIKEREAILNNLKESVSAGFAGKGIIIHDLKYAGAVSAPDDRRYREGVTHLESLRRVFFENNRKLVELKGHLERDAMSMESLYSKYREMSLIIGKNPDILKYIYIDKMAPNLRLIVSSDKSALPAFLGENEKETEKKEQKAENKNTETETAPDNEGVNAE
ncbi:MAG: hypothetical protein FWG13_00480 [Leptospirales bacterium]|nr:hypothetical protein [Leptospirales bacterium]